MNSNLNYRPDIDGLRAVAVLAVVLHHLSASLVPGGYVGVDVFFVISGYLITGIISREMQEGCFTFARFYERRAKRIFPALFSVLTATLLAGYFLLLPSDYASTLRAAMGTLLFASNMVFWRDMAEGYFAATDNGLNPLLHTWSLAVEEQFYVFFPILLLLCFRYFRRHMALILTICALVSLAGAILWIQSKSVAVFFLLPFRAWELLVGALLAINVVPAIKSLVVREILTGMGLLAILIACFAYDTKTISPGLTALVPVLGTAAVIYAGINGPSLVGRLLEWKPIVYIGLISYSLYLWHWPLIVLTRYAIGLESHTQYISELLFVSLVMASLSYHLIEAPFRRSVWVTPKFVYFSSVVLATILMTISAFGLVHSGFEERFEPTVVQYDKARSPNIPYQNCNARPANSWCKLGYVENKPTVFLWGDSHLLSWGPVLNKILSNQQISAEFVTSSACPPLLGVNSSIRVTCAAQNIVVKNYLLDHPEIKTVVISAFWSLYFHQDSELSAMSGNPPVKGMQAASNALNGTMQWLFDNNKQVIVIGPVPIYEKSVPLSLALEKSMSHPILHSSRTEQQKKHALFFEIIENAKNDSKNYFQFLDPVQWMCAEDCLIVKDNVSLYRDAHHLSIAGAMNLEKNFLRALVNQSPVDVKNNKSLALNNFQIK